MVLSREAHRKFMQTSGLSQGILNSVPASEDAHRMALELRIVHSSKPIKGELNRAICDVLIRLGASSVAVISEEATENNLKSIPEVKNAVREAWLSLEGLTHQIEAACRGEESPTWPVLVQREISPDYIGWSTTGQAPEKKLVGEKYPSPRSDGALYDLEPVGEQGFERESKSWLMLKAGAALGRAIRVRWGLREGRWYVLSVIEDGGPRGPIGRDGRQGAWS